jgi:hypothetical protein
VAAPLVLGGEVVAVVCGQQASDDDGRLLVATFEVLARHAARVLEALTASRLAQVGLQA